MPTPGRTVQIRPPSGGRTRRRPPEPARETAPPAAPDPDPARAPEARTEPAVAARPRAYGDPGPEVETEEFRVPDSAEPLLGWRVWHLDRDGLLKPIVITGQPWMPGPNEARCHMAESKHRAPGRGCVCGFNALHNPPNDFRGDAGHAIGVIAAWGDIDIYGTGLRAQFAAVIGLLDDGAGNLHAEKLRKAAAHYGVPLLPFPELREHASQFGKPASGAILPSGSEIPAGWGGGLTRASGYRARSNRPVPSGALPSAFKGRGVWINRHLAVDHDGRFMRLGPTPSLGALATKGIEPSVEVGQDVKEGDVLFVSSAGPSAILTPSPVRGTVIHINGDPLRTEEGPAAGGWVSSCGCSRRASTTPRSPGAGAGPSRTGRSCSRQDRTPTCC